MDTIPMVRIASVSVPSASVTTLGRFSIAPTPRIATCGWLMMGAPAYDPNTPGLVIVNVPRWISSGDSFLVRARSPRSLRARASPDSDSRGQGLGARGWGDDRRPPLNHAQDVLLGHATREAGPWDGGDVHLMLGRDLTDQRRGLAPQALFCGLRPIPALHRGGRGR